MPCTFCFQRKAAPSLHRSPQSLKFSTLKDSRKCLQPINQLCHHLQAETMISAESTVKRCGSHPVSHPLDSEQSSLDTTDFLLPSQNSSLLSKQVLLLEYGCLLQWWKQQAFICSLCARSGSVTKQMEHERGMTPDCTQTLVSLVTPCWEANLQSPQHLLLSRGATRTSEGQTTGTSFLASLNRQYYQKQNCFCCQDGTLAQNKPPDPHNCLPAPGGNAER